MELKHRVTTNMNMYVMFTENVTFYMLFHGSACQNSVAFNYTLRVKIIHSKNFLRSTTHYRYRQVNR